MAVIKSGASTDVLTVDPVTKAARAMLFGGAAGGWTPGRRISDASVNAVNVKASAGQLGFAICINLNAAVRYLKLYDKASAPTVGTDVPVQTYPIPGNATGAGFVINFGAGLEFTAGISFAITVGIADVDVTGVAANEIIVNYGFK